MTAPVARCAAWLGAAVVILSACRAAHPIAAADTRAAVRAAEDAERGRRHDEARARFQAAIAQARDRKSIGFARARFGETLLAWGEYREGAAQLEASVAAYQNDPEPWHNLGLARAHLGDPSGATDALERARTLVPTDWRPRISLAELRWHLATNCFRTASSHGHCATLVAAAQREYHALLELPIPNSLRTAIAWALRQLELPFAGLRPDVVPASPP